jgi:hypothetical protein
MRTALFIVWACLAAGCGVRADRPGSLGYVNYKPWSYAGNQGITITTAHYEIHSTVSDRQTLDTLAVVMEGALGQYQKFVPGVQLSARPMECFVFARRSEWADFTREKTGPDATIYLKINRGGYTVRDWYVAYFIGDVGTYAVAAHEGWHQFVARHFRSRLPPFLEEGIATLFETIDWDGAQPRWKLGANRTRADKLRAGLDANALWPLEQLITMHAGDVVNLSGERVETFYAQNWAFALFLWDGDGQRYRPALQQMLGDLAAGNVPEGINVRKTTSDAWDPSAAQPLLEHYLRMKLPEIDEKFQAYMRQLAGDRRRQQVNAPQGKNDP